MGGDERFGGLGSLREASRQSPLDAAAQVVEEGPVLGSAAASNGFVPALATIPRKDRGDFLADLYLVLRPRATKYEGDPFVSDARLAALADAAATVAANWDNLVAAESSDNARAARLISAVDAALTGDRLVSMGAFEDWMTRAHETLRRAAIWPADAVSTVFAELRPTLNEFIAYFIGDVFAYLNQREEAGAPGEIPKRVMVALRRALARRKETGEKIVVVTHSMGGQVLYDVLTHFAPADPSLDGIEIDHWISCGSQVSLFAELRLFRGQPDVENPQKLARPKNVKAWSNFFDRNDFVGFIMSPVFEGVVDLEYDTGYGLAFAHTGFLARPSFFEEMASRL